MRIFYVDDSGGAGLTTFSAIDLPAGGWAAGLDDWLRWRRHLWAVHAIPVHRRLHATDWVAGRGRPSQRPADEINRSRSARWAEYVAALETLAAVRDMRVLTVARPGTDRRATYRILMRWIDEHLRTVRQHGLVVVDGDSDELRTIHRELELRSRAIVEDPWKRDARESPWLQAADFVAYAAFQHIARRPERAFMWHWYERCLGSRIVRDARSRYGVRGLDP